jgi:hypothetical protein
MTMFVRINKAKCLGEHQLSLEFSDGVIREIEIHRGLGGVFSGLDDEELFSQVSVDPTTGTLVWPGGLDLDPDVLYGVEESATGSFFTLLSESRFETQQ